MADEAVEHIGIGAPPDRCFEVAVDFEHYPRWATDVKEVEVLARDAEGRGTKVRFAVSAMGMTLGYILDYDYAGAPTELSWKLAKADILTVLDGSYRFDPDPGAGDAATRMTYRLAVDLNLPMPGFMKRRAAGMIIQNAVKGFKRYLEAAAPDD
ncbi:MAG: SRPBCC family protein [Acidimicrobiia bacterium]